MNAQGRRWSSKILPKAENVTYTQLTFKFVTQTLFCYFTIPLTTHVFIPSTHGTAPIQRDLWPLVFLSFICHFHLQLCSICSLVLLPVLCVPGLTKTAVGLVFLIYGLLIKCSSGCILISKYHKHPNARSIL